MTIKYGNIRYWPLDNKEVVTVTEREKKIIALIMEEYGQLSLEKQEATLNVIANMVVYWRFNHTQGHIDLIVNLFKNL